MSAQTINISTVEVCAGQEVFLPVTASALSNVGAITLYIGFDTTNLTFSSIENVDPQLTGMSANIMTLPSQLAFAWSNTVPINFVNDKLFDIKFISNGQSGAVTYNSGCEIADPMGAVIPAVYVNGAINAGQPVIEIQPKDTTLAEGGHAYFSLFSPNAISYFWKESQDQGTSWLTLEDDGIYSGTHSPVLSISPVPLSYDKNQYQCVLIRESCLAFSSTVILSVDKLTSDNSTLFPEYKNLIVSPVPFSDHTNVEFTLTENNNVLIQVMNCMGQIISEVNLPSQSKGHHHILLNTSVWRPGAYFLKFTLVNTIHQPYQVVKIIKYT